MTLIKQKLLLASVVIFFMIGLGFSLSHPLSKIKTWVSPNSSTPVHVLGEQDPPVDLSKWQALYALQPQHRDVLINLSRLYRQLGQVEEAAKLWQQAQALDPNNPVFQQSQ